MILLKHLATEDRKVENIAIELHLWTGPPKPEAFAMAKRTKSQKKTAQGSSKRSKGKSAKPSVKMSKSPQGKAKPVKPLGDPKEQIAPNCCCGQHAPEPAPPAASDTDWKGAFTDVVEFLRYMDDMVRAISQAEVPSEDFLDLLQELDETGQTLKGLDTSKLSTLDSEARHELFRRFITDVFVTKMTIQRELAPIEDSGILTVMTDRSEGPLPESKSLQFNRMFLGLLQTVIAAHLSTGRGTAVDGPEGEEDLFPDPALLDTLWSDEEVQVLGFTEEDMAEGLWNLISPFDMLKLTSTAVMAYLTWKDPKISEDFMVEGLAALTPPVFILLACTDTVQKLVLGLVCGTPLFRKGLDDGSGSKGAGFYFVLTEEGQRVLR